MPTFLATLRRANRVPSALLRLLLDYDLPGKIVHIHAPLAKNADAVMSLQYSSIRPSFQATFLSRKQ
jgi:hypothetical protein